MIWFEELQTRKKLSRIFSAYEKTFPADERRDEQHFLLLIEEPDCFIYGVKKEDLSIGYLILWQCKNFWFLEHFEVFEEYRNLKSGSEILSELKEKFIKIVLESEPQHLNEMAARRIQFYERNGFSVISDDYIQPSYGEEKISLNLFLLSNFSPNDPKEIQEEIYSRVYKVQN